jgi:hypothetical protein
VADGVLKLQVEDRAGVGTSGTQSTHIDDESLNPTESATDLNHQNPISISPNLPILVEWSSLAHFPAEEENKQQYIHT